MERREFLYWLGLAGVSATLKPLWSQDLKTSGQSQNFKRGIDFDRRSILLNGERKFIFSGSVHYFRLPSPRQWERRIKKLKELGFNAVDVYYYWAYHSPREGVYDFKGTRDIELFMQMIEDNGMYLIARPGPYICAEIDGGGFPGWLIAKKHLRLRCRQDGKFVYDEEYMRYVKEWYEQVLPKIVKCKNLLLLQIENEYGLHFTPRGAVAKLQGAIQDAFGQDVFMRISSNPVAKMVYGGSLVKPSKRPDYAQHNQYMKELYDLARSLGCAVPIFHNDVGEASKRYVDVDIPAIDNYPITNMVSDWKKGNPFAGIDNFETDLDALNMNSPLFGAEIQGGWYDLWGGYGFEHIRRHLGPLAMDLTLKSCLAQGISILNIYMASGGTNWGYTPSPDNYSSYDYGAPLTEAGRISERGYPCQRFREFVKNHERDLLESVSLAELSEKSSESFCKARRSASGNVFLFARNLSGRDKTFKTDFGEFLVRYPGMDIFVLDKNGRQIDHYETYQGDKSEPIISLPGELKIKTCKFQIYDAPLRIDDKDWVKIDGSATDIDSLGFYYGYAWYRTRFKGAMKWLKLDARHCWAVYLNGTLIKAYDNFHNRVGSGEDLARTIRVDIPAQLLKDENLLVILTESLGHNKGFMEDSHNPRGLVRFESDQKDLRFEAKQGLVPGETGITPKVDFSKICADGSSSCQSVSLPHRLPDSSALGIYLAEFELDIKEPEQPGVGVKLSKCSGKANIYINGWLAGRYWEGVGPQKVFYLPPDLLNLRGKNELAIVVWTWEKDIALGEIELVEYP